MAIIKLPYPHYIHSADIAFEVRALWITEVPPMIDSRHQGRARRSFEKAETLPASYEFVEHGSLCARAPRAAGAISGRDFNL
jgi:hypothetical protein